MALGFALDFASNCGIDCNRCWPIEYARYRALASEGRMHGGLYVEMAGFFVSRIVAGLRVTAKMRQAFPLQFLF